jgi:hypothetical protein
VYQEFIQGAFGEEEAGWDAASPTQSASELAERWKNGRLVLLARSRGDELIDQTQMGRMAEALEKWRSVGTSDAAARRVILVDDLQEAHDDVWAKGTELVSVIQRALVELIDMEAHL